MITLKIDFYRPAAAEPRQMRWIKNGGGFL